MRINIYMYVFFYNMHDLNMCLKAKNLPTEQAKNHADDDEHKSHSGQYANHGWVDVTLRHSRFGFS